MAAALVLLATTMELVNAPPLTGCRSELPAAASQYWFRATDTMVQPWRRLHYVYGMFSVPDQYRRDHLYTAGLMIQGFIEEFPETSHEGGDIYNDRSLNTNSTVVYTHWTIWRPENDLSLMVSNWRIGRGKFPSYLGASVNRNVNAINRTVRVLTEQNRQTVIT